MALALSRRHQLQRGLWPRAETTNGSKDRKPFSESHSASLRRIAVRPANMHMQRELRCAEEIMIHCESSGGCVGLLG